MNLNTTLVSLIWKYVLTKNYGQNFNYWQLLRKNVAVNRTIVDDLNTPIDYDNNKFLDSITEYILAAATPIVSWPYPPAV